MERVHAKPTATVLRFGVAVCFIGPVESSFVGKSEHIASGPKIEVVETNLKKDTGTFAAVSDDAIRINESTGEQTIPRASVMRVTLRQNKHRLRNTLIGQQSAPVQEPGSARHRIRHAHPCVLAASIKAKQPGSGRCSVSSAERL